MAKFKIGDHVRLKSNYRELKPYTQHWNNSDDYLSRYEGEVVVIDDLPNSLSWDYPMDDFYGEPVMSIEQDSIMLLEQILFVKEN